MVSRYRHFTQSSTLTRYSSSGHMRARACWVLHHLCETPLKNPQILPEIMRLTSNALLNDDNLPVKVEAAIALQIFLSSDDRTAPYIEPKIKEITEELLKTIRETENEDLTNVMQKIVCTFADQLQPIAVDICQHLATTFSQVLESEEGSDEKAITAMGLLNTIETLLTVMEEQPAIMDRLRPIVINVVGHIFTQNITGELMTTKFFENPAEFVNCPFQISMKKHSRLCSI